MLRTLLVCLSSLLLPCLILAQNDEQVRLENLRYYLSGIKDNSQAMRYYTDSARVLELLDKLDGVVQEIDSELNKFIIPEVAPAEPPAPEETVPEAEPSTGEDVYSGGFPTTDEEQDEDGSSSKLGKVMPFNIKLKTSLRFQFGINSLAMGNDVPAGIIDPEIRIGSSWFTDLGLVRSSKLGGKKSKVKLQYGISYLVNRFSFENDIRLTRQDDTPVFVTVNNAKGNTRLNIGYLNIPLGLRVDIGKKSGIEIGGYGGVRVSTVQTVRLREGFESIEEHRHSGYQLRNFILGGTATIDVSGFRLVGRYNFSSLFKDNPNYDFNTWMIGTYFKLL